MKVEVKLYASLTSRMPEITRGKPYSMEVREGTTIQNLLEELKVPRERIKLVFLNGVYSEGNEVLKEGDSIYFNSYIPHSFRNVHNGKTIAIWVVTPPSF